MNDVWAVGAAYEAYMGRWSRPVARELVRWLGLPPGARWLDVGSGAGALAEAILGQADPASVTGVDRSPGFVGHTRGRVADPRASFQVGDAQALPVPPEAFDAAVSGLVLNFVPVPARMIAELRRAVRPGGTVALYVWDYAGGMQLLRRFWDAAIALDPAAAALDEAARFPVCAPGPLHTLLHEAGFARIEGRALEVPTVFANLDDLWIPFLGGQGPAPTYVASLPPERRDALRDRLRATLPFAADGSIPLGARAWAVQGMKPG